MTVTKIRSLASLQGMSPELYVVLLRAASSTTKKRIFCESAMRIVKVYLTGYIRLLWLLLVVVVVASGWKDSY